MEEDTEEIKEEEDEKKERRENERTRRSDGLFNWEWVDRTRLGWTDEKQDYDDDAIRPIPDARSLPVRVVIPSLYPTMMMMHRVDRERARRVLMMMVMMMKEALVILVLVLVEEKKKEG